MRQNLLKTKSQRKRKMPKWRKRLKRRSPKLVKLKRLLGIGSC